MGHKASTTRFLGQVDAAIAGAPLDVAKITQLKQSPEDKLTSLNTLDKRILTLMSMEAIEDKIIQADEVREQIYTALSRLDIALKTVPVPAVSTKSPLEGPVAQSPAKRTDTATTDINGTSLTHHSAIGRPPPVEALESTTEACA